MREAWASNAAIAWLIGQASCDTLYLGYLLVLAAYLRGG